MRQVLGIDFSLTSTGIYFEDGGEYDFTVVKTNTKMPMEKRVTKLLRFVDGVLKKYPQTTVVLEAPAFMAKGSRVYQLFGAHFAMWLLITRHTDKLITVPPTTLKKFATGSGRADKQAMLQSMPEEIKQEVMDKYKVSTGLYDVADAFHLVQYGKMKQQIT